MWTYGWSMRDLVLAVPATIALIIGAVVVAAFVEAWRNRGGGE